MAQIGDDGGGVRHHRDRARVERLAAARASDERARQAHLGLAMQHEIAMFRSGLIRRDDALEARAIGAALRAVIALPDDGSGLTVRLDVLRE